MIDPDVAGKDNINLSTAEPIRCPMVDDGRGVIIKLTEFGREKRAYSKQKVLTFNEVIKDNISDEKLKHFYEVAETISDMVSNKKIYNQNESILK